MPINPERIQEVFLAAAEREGAAERARFLDGACDGDAELRDRVEALLRAHDEYDSFLDQTVLATDNRGSATASTLAMEGSEADADEVPLAFLESATRPDSLGRIGHYEMLQVLGKGAFGIVFRAFDEVLHRIVGVKVLSPELAATSPARKRFLREARSSAQVRHENVVQVYEIGEQPLPYIAMEFIPGETLQQRLDRTGPLGVPDLLKIGRQIAEGLAAAHAQGLIHRDIKPGNILIESSPNEHVKISDFGLARAADDASISQSGIIAGTPMYMAPEQAHGDKIDHRADLFSLGSVLYTMASGRPPFRANSTMAVLKRVTEDTPRPIAEIIPEMPQWICDLITRLHAKNPEDRLSSAREVADLLGQGLVAIQQPRNIASPPAISPVPPRAGAVQALTIEPPKPAPVLKPRHRHWAAAAAVFLLLLGGFGVTEATGVTDFRGTVIRLFAPEGTLVVEVDDPGVSVKVDGSDIVITGAGAQEVRLKPGSYTLEARKDGKVVSRELVTITKNRKRVARVSQESVVEGPGPEAVATRLPPTFKNSIGMEFVIVPKGNSWLGGGKDRLGDKEVVIPADFYLGKYEVTQEEWEKVMGENPSHFSRTGGGKDAVKDISDADLKRFPVEMVSWDQCQLFVAKLNKQEKETAWIYRLPTVVEWEYACRSGPTSEKDKLDSAFDFYFAKPTNTLLTEQANFDHEKALKRTCKVGSYAPNVLGLYDMHGNVLEWCEDIAWRDPHAKVGSDGVSLRVYPGGSWYNKPGFCCATSRVGAPPTHRINDLGFRLARVPISAHLPK